jgi:bacteriorhodopsin
VAARGAAAAKKKRSGGGGGGRTTTPTSLPTTTTKKNQQVSPVIYERSALLFGTALAIDLLNAAFQARSQRLSFVLLPCFVKATATTTNLLARAGAASVALGPGGRLVMLQRYVCWMHTTPSLLLLVKLMASTLTWREVQLFLRSCCVLLLCVRLGGG